MSGRARSDSLEQHELRPVAMHIDSRIGACRREVPPPSAPARTMYTGLQAWHELTLRRVLAVMLWTFKLSQFVRDLRLESTEATVGIPTSSLKGKVPNNESSIRKGPHLYLKNSCSSYFLAQINVGTRRLTDFVADIKRPNSRLAEHVRRLCIRYEPSFEECLCDAGFGNPSRLPFPEHYTMDISELLCAIHEMAPRLSLFSLYDLQGQNRYLRVRSDDTLPSSRHALCFDGEVRLTGLNTESALFFLQECKYVKTLKIDGCSVPVLSTIKGTRDLQVGALSVRRYGVPEASGTALGGTLASGGD
ncbi:uncharacterized protein PHACADRAFT_187116 [Phanerochaete carnosa HHB-10118-sp]|uniref:Uncharacterized protein n=1 Tax=Phanerochaete carnosa (strain HHB-10118-sp) TaxID=650164 RepID=K5VJZ7_PHACS|nr:uncharacterized protein PHACADRAFT_187116 [Phanerochaete carnosa HHB-10118-sp]EKM51693.1 hypothetical protein PHACADRAFT_187116 [Phanerochaete carnosa HHB-10118-sp]